MKFKDITQMNRKDWNEKIYYLLKFDKSLNACLVKHNKMDYFFDRLWKMIHQYPDWRFGQILYNKFAPLYEQRLEGEFEEELMYVLFYSSKYDPFYEESEETYKRLNNKF